MEVRNFVLRFPRAFRGCLNSRSNLFIAGRNASSLTASSSSSPSSTSASSSPSTAAPGPAPLSLGSLSQMLGSNEPAKSIEEYTNEISRPKEHHLHIYTHRNNTHLTLTGPSYTTETGMKRNTLMSFSAGNIGFRKRHRGSYDAAFQLGAYLMSRIQNQGLLREIQRLELVFRGFGPGRDAIIKILLGVEGAALRPRIVRVADSTRLKIGGTRSNKPKRR